MKSFLREHRELIHGVLSGLDRVRFRGTIRSVCYADGLFRYLSFLKVFLVAFKAFFEGTARKLKRATERLAAATPAGRVIYLAGTHDKEALVRKLLRQHAIAEDYTGVIAVLSRHLRSILHGSATTTPPETKRSSGRMTRQLQRLRAHGLIRKIPNTHRYKITARGRLLATATSYVQDTNLKTLAVAA